MEAEFLALFDTASKATDAAAIGGGDDESQCLDALRSLKAFPVTSQLLVTTQVGKSLRCLTKHPQEKIQAFAAGLLQDWKQIVMEEANSCKKGNGKNGDDMKVDNVKENKVQKGSSLGVQVSRSDSFKVRKTDPNGTPRSAKCMDEDAAAAADAMENGREKLSKEEEVVPEAMGLSPKLSSVIKCSDPIRDRVRDQLFEALSKVAAEVNEDIINEVNKCDPARVAVSVESAMYEKWGKMNGAHKVRYRSIMFNIKDLNNPDFRRKVLLGQVTPVRLLNMTTEEMASEKRQIQNQQIKEKALFECELGAGSKATTDQFKCGLCGQRRCTYYQMQTRSADEPMTTYVTCVNCNNHWKFC